MQRIHKFVRRWRFILIPVLAFFSEAIPAPDEIPMLWRHYTSQSISIEVADVGQDRGSTEKEDEDESEE